MKKFGIVIFGIFCIVGGPVAAQDLTSSSSLVMTESTNRISLDVKGMDLIDVLKMLSSKTRMNLVIDKNVAGRVTVFLKDVLPSRALEVILSSNGLVGNDEGGIMRIMTEQDYEQLHGFKASDTRKTLRLKLKYARPQDVAATLNQVKSNIGRIIADDAAGAVILFDTARKNDEMAKMAHEMDAPLKTRIFKLNYARCEKIAEMLQDVITRGLGSIKIDTRANQLIITDYEAKLTKIEAMLSGLDERTKEVLIDAKIVQVNLDDKTSLGIDWEYVLNKKLDVTGMFGQVITTTGNRWTIGTAVPHNANDYRAVIEALKTIGHTKILSSPRLTVTNNEGAKILVGSKQVYVTTTAVQGQTTTETAEAVNFVDVGVKLYVTPTISHDHFISMKIRPEVSAVVQNYKTSTGNLIPIVETSEAETTVLVRDGATIIIAGLMKEEKSKDVNKIPILGSIPLLGYLFSNTVDETKKTELVIFLTCRILEFNTQ